MPIYEYKCKDCGAHFEKRQALSDEPLKTCEKCNGAVEKQWSLSGFQFKGAGWYVTDYAGKKSEKSESTDKGETASGGKSEKGSGSESTEKSGDASKTKSEPAPVAKTDSGSKKE